MSEKFHCPACGDDTDTLHEGYCEPCCTQQQANLDVHNASYDRWQSLTDRQRTDEIDAAARYGFVAAN